MRILSCLGGPVAALLLFCPAVAAQDRHDGYYYPKPESTESYTARATVLPDSNRDRRLGFIVAIFAKGGDAEKLIIVALDDGIFATLFRARAVLATLTAQVRASPLFAELGVQNLFTFYDLAKLLGFQRLTISDGRVWSHRVELK